jgi:hypothetical protein
MLLVAGVRWSFRGKDAGSVRIDEIRARLRTPHRGEQRGPAAQPYFASPSNKKTAAGAAVFRGEEELLCRAAFRQQRPLSYKDPGVRRIFQSM